jgi:inhibitor of KinA sporulation pathway (predicted exonuclease)
MEVYYLCILDFEATCFENNEKLKYQMEIIEFPSILYKITNNKYKFVSEFHKYVKPTINPILTNFCKELTGIQQETVNKAETIDVVYKEHIKWLNTNIPYNNMVYICTCGHWDLKTMLPREIKNKNLIPHKFYKKYINVKDEFEYFYKSKVGSMLSMLSFLNLNLEGRHHSGIDDTKNIAKIMMRMIGEGHNKFTTNDVT